MGVDYLMEAEILFGVQIVRQIHYLMEKDGDADGETNLAIPSVIARKMPAKTSIVRFDY